MPSFRSAWLISRFAAMIAVPCGSWPRSVGSCTSFSAKCAASPARLGSKCASKPGWRKAIRPPPSSSPEGEKNMPRTASGCPSSTILRAPRMRSGVGSTIASRWVPSDRCVRNRARRAARQRESAAIRNTAGTFCTARETAGTAGPADLEHDVRVDAAEAEGVDRGPARRAALGPGLALARACETGSPRAPGAARSQCSVGGSTP